MNKPLPTLAFAIFLLQMTTAAVSSRADDAATAVELGKVKHEVIEIHGVTLGVASHFEKLGQIGDETREVILFVSPPNLEDLSHAKGLLRVKSIAKDKNYSLSSELEKLEGEWREFHNVAVQPTLKAVYQTHPFEKLQGKFHAGVGNIVRAKIISNDKNEFVLFTYAAESGTHAILLSLFSPSKKMSKEDYDRNKLAFELLAATVP